MQRDHPETQTAKPEAQLCCVHAVTQAVVAIKLEMRETLSLAIAEQRTHVTRSEPVCGLDCIISAYLPSQSRSTVAT
jgi:hypothetical protein